ncbi:uncharacterized protein [Arachis hypogaea]|uniref:uncharacterized protein n=1 Tax=Arachis hypogaea TaxID=3818 RepID=UPI003B227C25
MTLTEDPNGDAYNGEKVDDDADGDADGDADNGKEAGCCIAAATRDDDGEDDADGPADDDAGGLAEHNVDRDADNGEEAGCDAMTICRYVGYPNLFLTFTCNSKWSKNDYILEDIKGEKSDDRPDIVSHVFSIKLMELINDIKRRHIFGRVTAGNVDEIISAEIPSKEIDPVAYSAVNRFMVHGPCGVLDHNSPCMINDKCSKYYPKRFHDSTSFDDNGFPIYMRRHNGRYILNGFQLDNRHVVPYNRNLLVKSVKYIFKYINKGPDCATVVISDEQNSASTYKTRIEEHDEIKAYLDCRYTSATEAVWRIYQFDMLYRKPAVERLSFYLPDQQPIYFQGHMSLENIMNCSRIEAIVFTEWMKVNSEYIEARQLTYSEFPTKYVEFEKLKLEMMTKHY